VKKWIESIGVHKATAVVRLPPNPDLEMAARVCWPLHFEEIPLGYLWMVDDSETITDKQLDSIGPYVEELSLALYRARLLERDDRERERDLVAELIGQGTGDPAAAAEALVMGNHLSRAQSYAVMVLGAVAGRGEVSNLTSLRVIDAAEQLRRAVAPRHLLIYVDGSQVVVLLASTSNGELDRRSAALARLATQRLDGDEDCRTLVGVGEEQADPAKLFLAYRQALTAVRIAAAVGLEGPVVPWGELGAYRILVDMLGEKDPKSLLPSSFRRLAAASGGGALIETLACFLDTGGDVRAAAEALHLHRSSLYGRLRRIEKLAGVDLRSGEDRLELHLALRLWRLGGELPSD
jgi:sugar diacid utilization regulator